MCHPGVRAGLGKPASVGGWPGGSASMPPPIDPDHRQQDPRAEERPQGLAPTVAEPDGAGSLTRPPVPPGAGGSSSSDPQRRDVVADPRDEAPDEHARTDHQRPLEPPLWARSSCPCRSPKNQNRVTNTATSADLERDEPAQPRHRQREPRQEPQRVLRRVHLVRQQETDQQRHAARPSGERRVAAAPSTIDRDERRDRNTVSANRLTLSIEMQSASTWRHAWYQTLSKSGVRDAVEAEELPPRPGARGRERQVDGDPGAGRPPQEADRAIGLPILQPLQEQRHEHQRGVELRRRTEPDQHARPPVAAFANATRAAVAHATAARSQLIVP